MTTTLVLVPSYHRPYVSRLLEAQHGAKELHDELARLMSAFGQPDGESGVFNIEGHAFLVRNLAASDFPVVRAALSDDGSLRLIVLHFNAEEHVARALDDNSPYAEASDEWLRSARELLVTYRAFRRRVTIVDARAATARPEPLAEILGPGFVATQAFEAPAAPNRIACWLAAQIVARSPAMPELINQIEACSVSVAVEPEAAEDPAALLSLWSSMLSRQSELEVHAETLSDLVKKLEAAASVEPEASTADATSTDAPAASVARKTAEVQVAAQDVKAAKRSRQAEIRQGLNDDVILERPG